MKPTDHDIDRNNASDSQSHDGGSEAFDADSADADERAEAAWLLARERDPEAPPPSPELARQHEELEHLFETMPVGPPDSSWHDSVLQQLAARSAERATADAKPATANDNSPPARSAEPTKPAPAPRPWHRRSSSVGTMIGTFAAVAAVAVAAVWMRPATDEGLQLAFTQVDAVRSGGDAHNIGERLTVKAPDGILRVYRNDAAKGLEIAHCPGGPGCTVASDGALTLVLPLEAQGEHHVLWIRDAKAGAVPASGATLDDTLAIINRDGGVKSKLETFNVR